MRYMATYDLMETMRNTNQWMGATAAAFGSYPAVAALPNPYFQWLAAWGEVTERTFARMVAKPDWGIYSVVGEDGRDHVVTVEKLVERPFGDLIHFKVQGRAREAAPGLAGGADVGPLRHAAALDRRIAAARCRGLHHRLAQCARHSGQRRQVRRRGLHALSRRFHARARARHQRDRGLPARAADPGRHRLSRRARPRGAAADADPDRRPDRPRRRRHRRDRFRQPGDDGPARRNGDPAGRLQISGRRAGWSIPACCSWPASCR